jgi:hypothetical protein
VLRWRFTPVNKKPLCRSSLVIAACAVFFLFFNFVMEPPVAARPDALEEGVERLAKKTAALPHERRMSLLWSNHSALSEQRVERLRAAFAAHMEAAQVRLVQGEAAPGLRVAIEQTPSQIVFTATVPGDGSMGVAIEEVGRTSVGIDANISSKVRLDKELLWRQETKILNAALPAAGEDGVRRLVVLTEDSLQIYGGGPENWKLEYTKPLPGPRLVSRSARGQLLLAEGSKGWVTILLPGRRCEASVADESGIACANVQAEWPAGRLMALPSCGTQTWWLKSDGVDWASQDRLLLRSAGASKETVPATEMNVSGPVISIGAADSTGSATVVTRDLSSGNYEVYRIALACGD